MNLVLLFDEDFINSHRVRLSGRRLTHILEILKAREGQMLTVGRANGMMGQGTVVGQNNDVLEMEVRLDSKPPQALPLTLVLALPRPPMLKRILFSAAMLGVKKIIILNFNRVEKSLWNSSALKPEAIEEQLILGLEQAKDTVMPEVILKKRFKLFVEDELPKMVKGKLALVAHPASSTVIHGKGSHAGHSQLLVGIQKNKPILLVIGPEGGILDYEIDLLKASGCKTFDLGPRILRTDNVLPFVVGKLF